jgi:hypothetical protein
MKSWLGNLDTFVNVLEAHVSLKKIESIVQGGIDGL